MKTGVLFLGLVLLTGCLAFKQAKESEEAAKHKPEAGFLPNAEASKVVSVTETGPAPAVIVMQTLALAVKETGPKETVARFGEFYGFSPSFFVVFRDEPTRIRFWNLQRDDEHFFMLFDPHSNELMNAFLPPLQETSFVFTFHEEGLFYFICTLHYPAMNGQILVLPPRSK
jgi:plastocyanin